MPTRSFRLLYSLIAIFCLSGVSTSMLAQDMAQDAPPPGNIVPQGTVFLIQLSDQLDTHTVKAGQHFEARLAEPLTTVDGQTIPAGKKIKGHVSAVEPGFRTRMILSFNEIDTGHGRVPLIATVTGVPGEHGLRQIGEEGEIGRQGMTKEEIAEAIVEGAGRGAMEGGKVWREARGSGGRGLRRRGRSGYGLSVRTRPDPGKGNRFGNSPGSKFRDSAVASNGGWIRIDISSYGLRRSYDYARRRHCRCFPFSE